MYGHACCWQCGLQVLPGTSSEVAAPTILALGGGLQASMGVACSNRGRSTSMRCATLAIHTPQSRSRLSLGHTLPLAEHDSALAGRCRSEGPPCWQHVGFLSQVREMGRRCLTQEIGDSILDIALAKNPFGSSVGVGQSAWVRKIRPHSGRRLADLRRV